MGTVTLHLTDQYRRNPWAACPPHRELIVSLWYPASDAARYPLSPQMLAGAAAHYGSPAGYGWLGYRFGDGLTWADAVSGAAPGNDRLRD